MPTRQAARRLVLQALNSELRDHGVDRRTRRRILFLKPRHFPISDMARELIRQQQEKQTNVR